MFLSFVEMSSVPAQIWIYKKQIQVPKGKTGRTQQKRGLDGRRFNKCVDQCLWKLRQS